MKYRFLAAVFLLLAATFATQIPASQAGAFPSANVTINGHGFGHGRGMGQYGALGYAVNSGWSWQQILDHYYSNTSMDNPVDLNTNVGVRMNELDGQDTIVQSQAAMTVAGQSVGANSGILIHKTGTNTFNIQTSGSCAGPWTTTIATGVTGPVTIVSQSPGNALNQVIQLCESVGTRGVVGNVQAVDDSGTQRTVNNLPIEDYIKGVIPRESPASWGDLGGGTGINALRAQAVAARSYVLASANYSYATTCDTTACQVYGGIYLNGALIQDSRSNTAANDTAGVVRRLNGQVARTEFSSSTGGYSAGGTFPAVPDDGDSYSGNPNHNWSVSVPVSTVEAAYPSIGSLQSIIVTNRNGIGDFGGRVNNVSVVGSNGTAAVTGADLQSKLGLKSTWFQIQGTPSGGVGGYWQIGNDGGIFTFGNAQFYGSVGGKPLNKPINGLAPNVDSAGYWEVASDGGIFAYGSSAFYGSMGGKPLNKPIVGMTPTPSGKGYWMVATDGGIFAFGDAQFYGSMGGSPLNKPIVGMASTPSGLGYWLVASDGGIFAFGDAQFYGSTGSIKLRQPIVGMSRSLSGAGYWLVAADGGVFAYGNAPFVGSLPGANVNATVTGVAATTSGQGYAMVTTNGNVYSFGDAPQFGNLSTASPNFRGTVLGIAPSAG